jgi:hypothetical protein
LTDTSTIEATLTKYGLIGVQALRQDVDKVSATGKTADSIRFEVQKDNQGNLTLTFYGRQFFKTIETGRGPRKSSTYGAFDLNLLEYMNARGIGADLSDKKKKQLAKFLAYRINRDGDETFQKGGRVVYSPTLTKLVSEIKNTIIKDFAKLIIRDILKN